MTDSNPMIPMDGELDPELAAALKEHLASETSPSASGMETSQLPSPSSVTPSSVTPSSVTPSMPSFSSVMPSAPSMLDPGKLMALVDPNIEEAETAGAMRRLVVDSYRSPTAPPPPTKDGGGFYFLQEASAPIAAPMPVEGFDVGVVRKDFPILEQKVNGRDLIWMDNAATTQKPQTVIDRLKKYYEEENSNVHRGAHTLAARATDAYEGARESVQRFLGAGSKDEIVFVRGTTEAINLVAQTFGRSQLMPGDEILLTTLEHHSNIVPWQFIAQERNVSIKVVPITQKGEVMMEDYTRLVTPRTKLVAISHVSNALGTVLPVKDMTQIAHQAGARVLVDGAQAVAHFPVNVQDIGADFYAMSSHKLFGPTGVGALFGKKEVLEEMPPWQGGGSMINKVTMERSSFAAVPQKFEAGTPIIGPAVGLGAAIEYVERLGMENIARHEQALTKYATDALDSVPGLTQIGTAPEKVGVLSFVMDGIKTEDLGKYLDQEGIAVRAGHHCAQPTLAAFGLDGTVRPSLAFYNTFGEIDSLVESLKRATIALGGRG